jgi:hypothetical protein
VSLPLACREARRRRHVAPIEGRDRLYISAHGQVPPEMTTDAGISVASDDYSLTVGPAGPNLLKALGTCSFPICSRSGCSNYRAR